MNRRALLQAIAGLPVVGLLAKKPADEPFRMFTREALDAAPPLPEPDVLFTVDVDVPQSRVTARAIAGEDVHRGEFLVWDGTRVRHTSYFTATPPAYRINAIALAEAKRGERVPILLQGIFP